MSVDYYMVGIMEPTEEFKKMYKVYKSCRDIGCNPPAKVEAFFDGDYPTSGEEQVVKLKTQEAHIDSDYIDCIEEISVSDLPSGVTKIQLRRQ